jgi:hypothetical protein
MLQVLLVTIVRALLRTRDRQRAIAAVEGLPTKAKPSPKELLKRRTHSLKYKSRVAMEAISGRKTIQDRSGGCRWSWSGSKKVSAALKAVNCESWSITTTPILWIASPSTY